MRERQGDLWDQVAPGAVICITTNGHVTSTGRCVMGRGCAKEARDRLSGVDRIIGGLIRRYGNRCFRLPIGEAADGSDRWQLVTFPVKHHYADKADSMLIVQSAEQLVEMADKFGWQHVFLSRPGCGNGRLEWPDVRDILRDILDDRFVVIDRQPLATPS
jgi:hypothetical protein